MKVPMPPPDISGIIETLPGEKLAQAILSASRNTGLEAYDPWDKIRFKEPPEGLTPEQSWALIKLARQMAARTLPELRSISGGAFSYVLPDELLKRNEYISRRLSASALIPSPDLPKSLRNHYLVSSIQEEAIRSSQLEGAVTSRRDAKRMLTEKREPANVSERMILNNYRAISFALDHKDSELTPQFITQLHQIVTAGTLELADHEGKIQDNDDERVKVWGREDQLLFTPPPVSELPQRMEALCDFANSDTQSYLPDTLKAITLHFMMGYNHFFEDGNGRTARALFYWFMLRKGYWLTQYISISEPLKNAPSLYGQAYLHTEQDGDDLTYFFLHQTRVIRQAIESWDAYLERKQQEQTRSRANAFSAPELAGLNERQRWIVGLAAAGEEFLLTAYVLAERFGVGVQSARLDFGLLEKRGLVSRIKQGAKIAWSPTEKLFALVG